jgi:uncharacterized protein (DUF1697 family)
MKKTSAENYTKYVALLRGINVGGHKKVPMADLKKTLEKMGFKNVRTLLASGNVLFEAPEKTAVSSEAIEASLKKKFGFTVPVILIPFSKIDDIIKTDPFRKIKLTPEIRRYATFLSEKTKSKLPIPYRSPDGSLAILSVSGNTIFSILDISRSKTPDAMNILEKEFGKNITTRNWNTIIKIGAL